MVRYFLNIGSILLVSHTLVSANEQAAANAEVAHKEIWRRLVDEYNIVLDYADFDGKYPRSTPEEAKEGKPNALAWWTATENGGMFNGGYMDAIYTRWLRTQAPEDADKARRLSKGLMLLASVSEVKGFIARCVASDGKTPYTMGSNDQTAPWFFGLWRYLQSGIPTAEEKQEITAKLVEVAEAIKASDWRMPCDKGAPSPFRGSFAHVNWESSPRLLFMLKLMHHITGSDEWGKLYQEKLLEKNSETGKTALEVCAIGMLFEYEKRHSWTCASGLMCLHALWELEEDAELKAAYAKGLVASAHLAGTSLEIYKEFDNSKMQAFQGDWRVLNQWWKPQQSEQEAVDVAMVQVRELGKMSPRRYQEFTYVREPAYASWIISLCPDATVVEQYRKQVETVIGHYDYTKLYYSQFFPVEAAWNRLALLSAKK